MKKIRIKRAEKLFLKNVKKFAYYRIYRKKDRFYKTM